MTAETATIKMSRLDCTVPWGFRLQGGKDYMSPMIINKIIQGGLAEKSGLREGDFLIEILNKSTDQMNHNEAQALIMSCGNEIEIKVERTSAKIWAPLVKPVALKPDDQNGAPVQFSLAHDHSQQSPNCTSTAPFNTSVRTVVIDGPSAPKQSENKQELIRENEEPAYLKSETLKLINESEKKNKVPSMDTSSTNVLSKHDEVFYSAQGAQSATLPQCQHCGRHIQGVFCKASGKQLHPECFVCATCGSNLKNRGYYVIGSKFYCEIHAKQLSQDHFKATPPIDPNLFYSRAPPLDVSPLRTEPVKAPYQPEILKRGEFLHAPKATSLSPSSRGIPTYSPKARGYFRVPEAHELELAGYPTQRGASPTHLLAPMRNMNVSNEQRDYGATFDKPMESSPKVKSAQPFTSCGPKRGKGIIQHPRQSSRVPFCKFCSKDIRGPFVMAFSDCFCPEHFVCSVASCRKRMLDVGFVDVQGDGGRLCCENCYEKFFAPQCHHCSRPITKECLNALQQQWHQECFKCAKCQQIIGNNLFFYQNGSIFCERDWNQLFTTKCVKCQYPIETGDRYVEALGGSYHANCFSCTTCHALLEGRSFYGKSGKPFCDNHV